METRVQVDICRLLGLHRDIAQEGRIEVELGRREER